MSKAIKILMFLAIGFNASAFVCAQSNDIGAIASISLLKDISEKWDAKLEQEFRFNNNLTLFDRSLTSIGLNYSIIRKLLAVELDYDFIQQRQNEYFELRQRSSVALSIQKKVNAFELELRTRGQAIWRDESRGDYKFNPKYVWRNKLECTYTIFGSPVKPFISAEMFCPLNTASGFYMDGVRATTGFKYRINQRTSMSFLVRYDQDIQQANPKSAFYGGVGWNYKL